MPKKRGHKEGSIYQRKDGRWVAEILLGVDASGKRKVWRKYGKTRKEVADSIAEVLKEVRQGVLVEPSKQTLGEFLDSWMNDVVQGSVRPSTFQNYTYILRHVEPLRSIPLSKLTPQVIQSLYRQMQERGLGRTIKVLHAILHKAMDQALKWGMVPRNVLDAVETPKIEKKEFRPLTIEETEKFLDAALEDRLYALYVLAVTCGLRFGELLGLKWEDVDLTERRLTVRNQLQWIPGAGPDGKAEPRLIPPKTAKSRRTIRLPDVAVFALKRHKALQTQERLRAGDLWQDWGLVFTTEIGTPLDKSNVRNRSFYPLLEKARLPRIRFHDLRHTCATLLLTQGVHPKLVQEQLGHSEISMTLDTYSHIIGPMMDEVARTMDGLLAPAMNKRR